jgi:RNA polymerase sigma-70 factor (ECF subfamily)
MDKRSPRDQETSQDEQGDIVKLLREHAGDSRIVGDLLDRYRGRLRQIIGFRLDRRLRGRIDASDVVQEAFLDALRKLEVYLRNPSIPFFLWLRLIAGEKVRQLHRQHLDAKMRAAGREQPMHRRAFAATTSVMLADHLEAKGTSPSGALEREERKAAVAAALESMKPIDREVLALRHFEALTNQEAACVLGVSESAASTRYFRAVQRLKRILDSRLEI